ncbi:TonB-dependent siderophore receptor [Steroidobacter sp.]|uniref:TonB-dependent siderophore receptor n=1 Tax=Steroidobacter sp. TaxID=1978227 RepID=UPI001A52D72E|nr:TonB-dependent receptor [Steroidobacter sp.]MBL8269822.1 TonB-dependent receptor [Steroidobacter sp.]
MKNASGAPSLRRSIQSLAPLALPLFLTAWANAGAAGAQEATQSQPAVLRSGLADKSADDERCALDVPRQDLNASLQALALVSQRRLLYRAELVDGLVGPALKGEFTVPQALTALLQGTGLQFEVTPSNVVVIRSPEDDRPTTRAPNDYSFRLASAAEPTSKLTANEQTVEEVVVTSQVIFAQNDAFGATKMGLAVKDTPQTVTVVTGDMIEFASIRSFNDLYKIDASGGTSHDLSNFPSNYYRGFIQRGNNAVRIDGFRMAGNVDLDMSLFDRVEVIKGATSTLYGQNSIGGSLNAVSKMPQDRFGAQFALQGGDFEQRRVEADVTGPVGTNDTWTYRVLGAYDDADSYIDYARDQVQMLSPSIRYQPNESTHFTLRAIYQDTDMLIGMSPPLQLAGQGTGTILQRVLAEGLQVPDVPRSRFFGVPWSDSEIEARFVQFQAEHKFANRWTLRAHAQYNEVGYLSYTANLGGPLDESGRTSSQYLYARDQDRDVRAVEVNLFGDIELFGRDHKLFFGADYNEIRSEQRSGFEFLPGGFANSLFNAFTPNYSAIPAYRSLSDYSFYEDVGYQIDLAGVTAQLILNPIERLHVLLGGRYSQDQLRYQNRTGSTFAEIGATPFRTFAEGEFKEVVFQGGVTYALTDAINLYASYGQTFEPTTSRIFVPGDPDGELIDPEEGTNYEIGLKADLSSDLSFSVAAFQMERSNIAQQDVANPQYSIPLGTQRSRGVELNAQGRLLPELSVFVSLAYLDAEFSDGEFKGLSPANAPRIGASLFGSYELLDGALQGLGFGLGVVYKGDRETFDTTWTRAARRPVEFDFGDFIEVDARVFYRHGRWMYTLSGTNLFDERYLSPTFAELDYGTNINPPRAIRFAVRYKL